MTIRRKSAIKGAPPTRKEMGMPFYKSKGLHPTESTVTRVFICCKCKKLGGTLENIGTHLEPKYKHKDC